MSITSPLLSMLSDEQKKELKKDLEAGKYSPFKRKTKNKRGMKLK